MWVRRRCPSRCCAPASTTPTGEREVLVLCASSCLRLTKGGLVEQHYWMCSSLLWHAAPDPPCAPAAPPCAAGPLQHARQV